MQSLLQIQENIESPEDCLKCIAQTTHSRAVKEMKTAAVAGTIYAVWHERNSRLFDQTQKTANQIVKEVKDQMKIRILYLANHHRKYRTCIDSILVV